MAGGVPRERPLVVFLPRYGYLREMPVFRRNVVCADILRQEEVAEVRIARDATPEDLEMFHLRYYVAALQTGRPHDLASSGLPWHPELFQAVTSKVGSFLDAIDRAATQGNSGTLDEGGHRARPGSGIALSPVNVLGIGVQYARRYQRRIMVLDLDLHFGSGIAAGLSDDPDLFLFDYHGYADEYTEPDTQHLFRNLTSQPDGATYLRLLRDDLPKVLDNFIPGFCLYLAGMNVFGGEPNPRLRLTVEEIAEREELVFSELGRRRIPVAYAHGGGDASEKTVARLHVLTARAAAKAGKLYRTRGSR